MREKKKTPFELGFRMPAEWEKHEATWLSWPKDPLTFPKNIIDRVEQIYVEMIEALRHGERVELLIDDQSTEDKVSALLSSRNNVRFHHIKTADVWIRDYGPIFVKDNHDLAATKWIFNAWGEKYDELLRDNEAGAEICKMGEFDVFEPGIVLEGGSIDMNGKGSCLTTRQCLLNENRNPELSIKQIENNLRDYLGVTNPIWLCEGIFGDDTDGHIDDAARFVNETTVLCMVEEDQRDENHSVLKRNQYLLMESKDQDGKSLELITVDMPSKVEIEGARLPASYANFYIGNSAVLVPVFGDRRNDEKAISKISDIFHGREIVAINCRELVYGFGGIHCVTQQQPSTWD